MSWEASIHKPGSSRDPRVGLWQAGTSVSAWCSAPAAAAEEVRPWLDGVGLLLSHITDYRELEHLSLIRLQEQEDPQDNLGQADQRP